MTIEEENREKEIAHAAESEYFVTKAEEFAWIHGAEWSDEHPRKGLCDAEKVIKFIKENVREYHKSGVFHVDDFIKDLTKAMED